MLERVDMKRELDYSALPMAVDPVILREDISLSPCVYSISGPTNDSCKVSVGIATRK